MTFYYLYCTVLGFVRAAVHINYTHLHMKGLMCTLGLQIMLVLVPVIMRYKLYIYIYLLTAACLTLISSCLINAPVFCALYNITTFLSILVSVTLCVHSVTGIETGSGG